MWTFIVMGKAGYNNFFSEFWKKKVYLNTEDKQNLINFVSV